MEIKIKNKKIDVVQIVRRLIQIVAFLLFPGLFALLFAALKDIFSALTSGGFNMAMLSRQLVLAGGTLLITALMGRFLCGFLCSFGAMQDFLWFLRKKLKLPLLKINEKIDRILKLVKYALLVAIIAIAWTGIFPIERLWDPWTIFGMYFSIRGWPSATNLVTIGGALLLLIIISSLVIERLFCRYLCPLGAVLALVSHFRLFRIKKPNDHCEPCRTCTEGCVMGIPLYRKGTVTSNECIDCFHCMDICPRNNMSANPKPAVAAIMTAGLLTGAYYGGNLAMNVAIAAKSGVQNQKPPISSQFNSGSNTGSGQSGTGGAGTSSGQNTTGGASTGGDHNMTDGVHKAWGVGYHGPIYVSVTVSGGVITNINIDSQIDDPEYFAWAQTITVANILSTQSVNVDTVAGATASCEGIKEAVAKALGWE